MGASVPVRAARAPTGSRQEPVPVRLTLLVPVPDTSGLKGLAPSAAESTSAPWVILVINVNISLVGSIFQISSTLEWHGQEDVEPLQDAKDKHWQKLKTLHFHF